MENSRETLDEFLAPGSAFGRYVIARLVGRGGMGAVYEATHTDLKKRVAIKTLHSRVSAAPDVRARFRREGESAARIRHPNVCDIYDVGEEKGTPYLVMEFLEGNDLGRHLKRQGRLAPREMADLMLPVVCALDVAHSAGVVHRDLKPSNVFLAEGTHGERTPKLVDFGISKIVDDQGLDGLTATGAVLGTPYYMSPEQAHGGSEVDPRSDQYSLGVILYQCATGERPFRADSMYQILHKIVEGDFVSPSVVAPDIPPSLEASILRAMARDPNHRHETVLDFGRTLLPFASPRVAALVEPALGRTEPPPPYTIEPSTAPALLREPLTPAPTIDPAVGTHPQLHVPQRFPMFAVAALGLLLGAVGLAALYFTGASPAPVVAVPLAERAPAAPSTPPAIEAPAPPALPETYPVTVDVSPESTTLTLDGEVVGVGHYEGRFEKDGTEHVLELSADGHIPQTLSFTDEAPESNIVLNPKPTPPKRRRRPRPPAAPPPDEKPRRGTNEALILR